MDTKIKLRGVGDYIMTRFRLVITLYLLCGLVFSIQLLAGLNFLDPDGEQRSVRPVETKLSVVRDQAVNRQAQATPVIARLGS